VSAKNEEALARAELTIEDLFDENYVEIPNTNPQQYMTRFVATADRPFPPILEKYRQALPQVQFAIAIDRNYFLPTHNAEYSKPQGIDPTWNEAHCRNRRFYKPRNASAGSRTAAKPLYLQLRRRDMGGGRCVMMKNASAIVMVGSRHWGSASIGYTTVT
jgi:methyl-accepting chemotaxis protein